MSNIATHPTQILLPGQAAAPNGPVDVSIMYVFHFAFRRDLRAFHTAAAATPLEDRLTWRRLERRWHLFGEFLHHHHTNEDLGLWPLLIERADADGRQVLADMEAEHDLIDPILEAADAAFARLAGQADPATGDELVALLAGAIDTLGHHLAHEESEAMRLVQELMTPADWEYVEKHFPAKMDVRKSLSMPAWAMYQQRPEAIDKALTLAPPVLGVVWRLTRRRFARQEELIFRYAG